VTHDPHFQQYCPAAVSLPHFEQIIGGFSFP